MRYVSFFSGGGGDAIGAQMAGAEPVAGYEYVPEIAGWNQGQLKHPVHARDILTLDPSSIEEADIFHFSPPCPSFSRANANAGETENDLALASAICEIIEFHKPIILTLENVWQYRKSESWKMIASTLNGLYPFTWDVKHVNFADLSVPQTRQRMVVRAVKGKMLPPWPRVEEWVGWYEAVEDIIDTFPEGKLANWQLERLPEKLSTMILNSTDSGEEARHNPREANEPMQTVTTQVRWKVLIEGMTGTDKTTSFKTENSPSSTIVSGGGSTGIRVLLAGCNTSHLTSRKQSQPSPVTGIKEVSRIIDENYKVLEVTTRGLARFMSFPDWYELPTKKTLANTILGNAVPPVGYSKILKPLIELLKE